MNNKDDIVGRLHVVKGSLQNRGFGGLSGEYESVVLAISRIQSDAKRIAELEAEVERLSKIAVHPLEGEYLEEKRSEGFWGSCSGCHETNEGAETGYYPYHPFFECYLGSGCHECGYLGAVWDDTDYEHMAKFMREYQEEPPHDRA